MAAQANLVLTDAESTPVNRTFVPQGVDGAGLATWKYIAAGQPGISACVATMLLRDPVPGSDAHKLTLTLSEPILEAVAGQTPAGYTPSPKVAFTDFAKVELVWPSRASQQNRKNELAMLRDLLSEGIITAACDNLEKVW